MITLSKVLTTFVLGDKEALFNNVPNNVEMIKYNCISDVYCAMGKYISFIDSEDSISNDYFDSILEKIESGDFDSCFINYKINYEYVRELKIRTDTSDLNGIIPSKGSYIWNFVFNKDKLLQVINNNFDNYDNIFTTRVSIADVLYYHNKDGKFYNILGFVSRKDSIYCKNIIYVGDFCNGLFNGYVTWLVELGKAFPDYQITILYTKINDVTKKRFEKYFSCYEINNSINYICDSLVTTYSTYFYPINIYPLKESSIFIHGNMSDYENSARFTDNIYDRYIAVSKIARDTAKGYFPTENIEYIYNPFTFDKNMVKPHLKLISAIRNSPEKGVNRIKKAAGILDNINIPYTWSVFTDITEANQGGLIFRSCVTNVIDYVVDCDYLVQFSRSEALSYSLTEALCAGTKIITTDIPAIHELGIVDKVNGIVIPIEYFDDGNEELLKEKLLEAYKMKDKTFDYNYDFDRFIDYKTVFFK